MKVKMALALSVFAGVVFSGPAAFADETPSPTPTSTETPSAQPTETPEPTPTDTESYPPDEQSNEVVDLGAVDGDCTIDDNFVATCTHPDGSTSTSYPQPIDNSDSSQPVVSEPVQNDPTLTDGGWQAVE